MTLPDAQLATVPQHVGFILDGNRRWAKANGKSVTEGHRRGLETFKDIALAAFDRGIAVVSAYIFSTENWQRTQNEVNVLMRLVSKGVERHLKTFQQAGIKIVMLGSRERVDAKVLRSIDAAIAATRDNVRGTLALCFNYGGQAEIAAAAQAVAANGEPITEEAIAAHLYEPALPPLDLVIRTSGEQRLSGFMLWRAAYSELIFNPVFWPDYSATNLATDLAEYQNRQRRFGR